MDFRRYQGCIVLYSDSRNMHMIYRFMEKFESLPNIKSYLNDPRYKQFPIWSIRAKYGYYPVHVQ